jgi:hypothetical protein
MPSACRWIALGLLLAAPVLPAQNLIGQAQTAPQAAPVIPPHRLRRGQAQVELPPMPAGPLSPVPMDQIPATPATVSFQDGLLTISAQNSSLGEILRDVRKLTGASIEIPQGPGVSERVVANLGPGAPRDILAGLLNGSSFNYVMVGSSSDPTAVSSLILSPRPLGAGETQAAVNPNAYQDAEPPPSRFVQPIPFNTGNMLGRRPGGLQPGSGQPGNAQPANGQAAAAADADDKDDDADDDKDDDQAATQPVQPGQVVQPDANAQDQAAQTDPNQPNAGPKTPEQIMQMLRNQQQPGALQNPPQPQQPPQQQ